MLELKKALHKAFIIIGKPCFICNEKTTENIYATQATIKKCRLVVHIMMMSTQSVRMLDKYRYFFS